MIYICIYIKITSKLFLEIYCYLFKEKFVFILCFINLKEKNFKINCNKIVIIIIIIFFKNICVTNDYSKKKKKKDIKMYEGYC